MNDKLANVISSNSLTDKVYMVLLFPNLLSTTATLSTEAEFLAAVTAAKHAKYLHAVLLELGYPQDGPTPLYEDNMSAINMINNRVPTERSRHIDIQHFAIQDWAEAKDIVMRHIPGILSISDGLTKVLGWVLHSGHARRMMGQFLNFLAMAPLLLL